MRKRFIWVPVIVLLLSAGAVWLKGQAPTTTPTIAAPTATPNLITVGTSTQVLFTISIPQPTLNPASVNLLRINATGSSTVVARMVDHGQNGDLTAGDKMFTMRVNLNQSVVGEIRFQVSAAFRGLLRRSVSPALIIAVLPPGVTSLPPDPGEAGKATLAGVDTNRNGIRDDVERLITFMNILPEQRTVLQIFAGLMQDAITIPKSGPEAFQSWDKKILTNRCLSFLLGEQHTVILNLVRGQMLNTKARLVAYVTADAQGGAHVIAELPHGHAACQAIL